MSAEYKKKRIKVHTPRQEEYTFEELYKEYWPVLQKAYSSVAGYHEAEDMAQEAMLRIWRYWDRIQWDKLEGVVGTIANHVRYDYLYKNFDKPDKEFYEDVLEFECHDVGIQDPLRTVIADQAFDWVSTFLEVLDGMDRYLFVSFYLENVTIEEMSEKSKLRKSHIYVQLHRIRELLKECYERYDIIPDGRVYK